MKKCPYCAEMIQDEAILCRYCGSKLNEKKINGTNKPAISGATKKQNTKIDLERPLNWFIYCLLGFVVLIALVILFMILAIPVFTYAENNEMSEDAFNALGYVIIAIVYLVGCIIGSYGIDGRVTLGNIMIVAFIPWIPIVGWFGTLYYLGRSLYSKLTRQKFVQKVYFS